MKAIISDCGSYRYLLSREPRDAYQVYGPALFVMLNPSTADASIDDPTIRRCRSFADAWGCAGIVVANLYGLRATDPKALWTHADPVGPDNDMYLASLIREHETIVCAWGANAKQDRVDQFARMFRAGSRPMCLGVTKSGAPRHPLYVKGDTPLINFSGDLL